MAIYSVLFSILDHSGERAMTRIMTIKCGHRLEDEAGGGSEGWKKDGGHGRRVGVGKGVARGIRMKSRE